MTCPGDLASCLCAARRSGRVLRWTLAIALAAAAWGWTPVARGDDVIVSRLSEPIPTAPLDAKTLTQQTGRSGLTGTVTLGAGSAREQTAIILWDEAKRVRQPSPPTSHKQGVINANIVH